jgi:hypothetical protein
MLDGLDVLLKWFLADVRPKFPESTVLFADESGGPLHRGTIRNRLRYLMELEGRPATERFSPHARGASRKSEREVVAGASRMVSAWGACATSSWPIG